MAPNDAVTHNGPTCPLDPLDVEDIYLGRSDGGEGLLVVALAVVAAERARLREAFRALYGEFGPLGLLDAACERVDAAARRA